MKTFIIFFFVLIGLTLIAFIIFCLLLMKTAAFIAIALAVVEYGILTINIISYQQNKINQK